MQTTAHPLGQVELQNKKKCSLGPVCLAVCYFSYSEALQHLDAYPSNSIPLAISVKLYVKIIDILLARKGKLLHL